MTPKRLVALLLVALLGASVVAVAQDAGGAYFEFLSARRLEGVGDFPAAQAALERAAKRRDDDFRKVRVVLNDRRGGRFNKVGERCVRVAPA